MVVSLDGRVAIVTGAGGGLGRSHAELLASLGARVVVNDIGAEPAQQVVAAIVEAGGQAVASTDGVETPEGGHAIVRTALDHFGRVDVVVNNAGILRDVTLHKMTPDEVDAVLRVHLLGAFHVTIAAWPLLREQGYGRVVNTSSGSGLYGNFGQSSYAAAKMGLVGLTRTMALEGARYGIRANAIAPLARSQMTEELLPQALLERLSPAWVSPLVAYLGSEACDRTGEIYSCGGGRYARVAILEGSGVTFGSVPSADDVAARIDGIAELGEATEPIGLPDQVARIAEAAGVDV